MYDRELNFEQMNKKHCKLPRIFGIFMIKLKLLKKLLYILSALYLEYVLDTLDAEILKYF